MPQTDLAGLRQGDLILEVNRKAVEKSEDFAKVISKADKDKPLLLLIQRGGANLYIPLKWADKDKE